MNSVVSEVTIAEGTMRRSSVVLLKEWLVSCLPHWLFAHDVCVACCTVLYCVCVVQRAQDPPEEPVRARGSQLVPNHDG